LGSAQPGVVGTAAGGGKDPAVAVDLQQRDAGVRAPADRIQAESAGVAEDEDAPHAALHARKSPFAAVLPDAVADDEVSVVDPDVDAVPVCDQHGVVSGVMTEGGLDGGARVQH
jgi:hypothetical protein